MRIMRVVEDARRELVVAYASDKLPRDSLAHLLNWIAKGGVAWIRQYEGLVRASLRRASSDRQSWTPMRELGRMHVAQALPHILRFAGPRADEATVRLAFQMMYGTLNTMVLIDPGHRTRDLPRDWPQMAYAVVESTSAS